MKTTYQQQAEDLLNKLGATIEITYLRNGKYFDNDKESRDIYKFTIKRGSRQYSAEFGNSIKDSGFYFTMGVQKIQIDRKYLLPENKNNLIHHIRRESGFRFLNNGTNDKIHYPVAPTFYDIISCLQKYDVGSFEDFCSDFGYDTDSKSAEKTYNAVCKEYAGICTLFTDSELEQLQEVQ